METLLGDASKAKNKLGWTAKISFEELVKEMVMEDLKFAKINESIKKLNSNSINFNEPSK